MLDVLSLVFLAVVCGANKRYFSYCLLVLLQDELSKTDQEVMRCKHHKKHYDEKRSAHLSSIQTLENNVAGKEKALQVKLGLFY